MFFTYVLLNITVSMVKGYYDANMRIKTESAYMVMTQLTLDAFSYIGEPKAEVDLKEPEDLSGVSVISSVDPELPSSQRYFTVKLR